MTPRPLQLTAIAVASAVFAVAGCGSDDAAPGSPTSTAARSVTPTTSMPPGGVAPAGYPVSVSSCGHTSTFEQAPSKVVVGWPTTVETLTALGVGDSVIGYISGDLGPAPTAVPNAVAVSPDYQPPREVMVATGTDFFLTNDENQLAGSDGGLGYDDLTTLDAGAYVLGGYCTDQPAPTEIDVVYDDITNLGRIFGVPDTASALVAELHGRAAVAHLPAGDAPSIAFVQVADDKLYALTGAYYKMAVDAVGFTNVFDGDVGNFSEISPEQVLTLHPDIVAVAYNDETTRGADLDAATSLLTNTPAVHNGRVVPVASYAIAAGGVNLFDVIDQLAAAAAQG